MKKGFKPFSVVLELYLEDLNAKEQAIKDFVDLASKKQVDGESNNIHSMC